MWKVPCAIPSAELYYKNVYRKKQNILKRDFYADKPNQKWTGDVAHLYVNKTKNTYYLFVIPCAIPSASHVTLIPYCS